MKRAQLVWWIGGVILALVIGGAIGFGARSDEVGEMRDRAIVAEEQAATSDAVARAAIDERDAASAARDEAVELQEYAEAQLELARTVAPVGSGRDPQAFIAVLNEIDPGLASNEERALSRADNICLDIQQGKDDATLAKNAELRYEGGTVPDITGEEATRIVAAARDYC